jgi:hypothetical protein
LSVQTPEANLVEGMKWFQNTVTRRFNVRHREWGRFFGDRYKAVVVDVTQGQSDLDYPWSSLAGSKACRRKSCKASKIDLEVVEIDLEHTENHFERAENDLEQARND